MTGQPISFRTLSTGCSSKTDLVRFALSHFGNDGIEVDALFRDNPGTGSSAPIRVKAPAPFGSGRMLFTQDPDDRLELCLRYLN